MGDDAKLEALRKRQAAINAQIAEVQARKKDQNRREETRLKILVGSAFLADMAHDAESSGGKRAMICEVLARAVTAPRDREFLKSRGWL